jgi:hypothetical protein
MPMLQKRAPSARLIGEPPGSTAALMRKHAPQLIETRSLSVELKKPLVQGEEDMTYPTRGLAEVAEIVIVAEPISALLDRSSWRFGEDLCRVKVWVDVAG